jgi:IclR helix-turn-helix domain
MVVEDATKTRAGSNGSSASAARASGRTPDDLVCLELTEAQVEGVIRSTADARGPSLSLLLSGLISEQAITEGSLEDRYSTELESGRLSHSLFRGLLILALFISGEEGRGVVEVARQLGLSPSTTHRYMTTLVAFGLLAQDPATRKYRLPL